MKVITQNNDILARAYLLRTDFKYFISEIHRDIFNQRFIFKPFHEVIIKELQALVYTVDQSTIPNLIFNIPVRFGKSVIVRYFIAWTYMINRYCNNVYVSASDLLIRTFSSIIKQVITSDMYSYYSGIKLSNDTQDKSLWQIDNGGYVRASSMEGAVTGFGAGIKGSKEYGGAIIIDDPIKVQDSNSRIVLQSVIDTIENAVFTRKDNPNTPVIIVMQRLNVRDLVGYLKEMAKKYPNDKKYQFKYIEIKALDENNMSIWEDSITTEALLNMRTSNPMLYYSQYQQEPYIKEGAIFKQNYFKRYDILPPLMYTIIYADTAMKVKEHNDYSVFQAWGKGYSNDIYLIDQLRGKWEAPELVDVATSFYHKMETLSMKIEDKSSGTGLIQYLSSMGLNIEGIPRNAGNDKVSRYHDASVLLKNNKVYIPSNNDWIDDYLQELSSAPYGANDDQADTTADAITDMFNPIRDYGAMIS